MKNKSFRFTEETIKVIQDTKKKCHFKSDTQTVEYLICHSEEEIKKGNIQIKKLEEKIDIIYELLTKSCNLQGGIN